MYDWALADVVRRAVELYVQRFPDTRHGANDWTFPTIDVGGDFIMDPRIFQAEVEAIGQRTPQ